MTMTLQVVDPVSEVRHRISFERLLADLSSRFINLAPRSVDDAIDDAQRGVCEMLGLDLAAVYQGSPDDPGNFRMTHLHRAHGGPPIPDDFDPRTYFPWALRLLLAGKTVRVSSLAALPPEASDDRRTWAHFGIKSALVLPLAAGGSAVFGCIGFHSTEEQREWSDDVVQRLHLVSQMFANALARKRTDETRVESEERLLLAAESAAIGMWSLDLERSVFWTNERCREIFGFPADLEITVEVVLESIDPSCRETVADAIRRAADEGLPVAVEYRIVLPDGSERWLHSRGRCQTASVSNPKRLLGATVDVTERHRAEAAQLDQLRFETLSTDLTASIMGARSDELDRRIERALQDVGTFFHCDRSGLLTVDDGPSIRLSHAWFDTGIPRVPFDRELTALYPWASGQLVVEGRTIGFSSLDELPEDASLDLESWRAEGVRSSLIVPLATARGVRYLLVVQSLREERGWPQQFIPRLTLLGSVFANALERRRADEELRTSYAEVDRLRRQLELENVYLQRERTLQHGGGRFVGEHPSVVEVLGMVEQVAPTQTTVLIEGETGTGKELIAQRIHELSPRSARPMVKVNCAALPSTLVESELFGREKGAYTGAVSREAGRFEIANGSTLFLDEVAELPLELQSKLLRVLEEGQFERVGSPKTLHTDARVVAATNRDLQAEVDAGRFRRDLFFRLAVFPIRIPPLRERREDIPLLVWSIVGELSRTTNRNVERIVEEDLARLQRYDWPGNVRELRNVVERALILMTTPTLRLAPPSCRTVDGGMVTSLDEAQRLHIMKALEATAGRISGPGGAAELLDVKPSTLRSRMQRLGLDRE